MNGMIFDFPGNVISLGSKAESCQTEGGMRIALRRAGFTAVSFRRQGFVVEARREGVAEPVRLVTSGRESAS